MMNPYILYVYARQYHAELLREAEQSRLQARAIARTSHVFDKILAQARSAIAPMRSKLFSLSPDSLRSRNCDLACESC